MFNNFGNKKLILRIVSSWQTLRRSLITLLSGKHFLWFAIGFFVLESTWIAVSFRFPMLFDENFHFGVISIFGKQYSPFIINQSNVYDSYGNLTFGSASIYHYLLSFPYRLIAIFTDNNASNVIILRLLNISFASIGLWIFNILFKTIGIRQLFINLAIFFYCLIPIVPFVAATISYDNLLFPLTALFLLTGVKIVYAKKIEVERYTTFVMIGMLASLVKFTFLPILLAGCVCIGFIELIKYKARSWKQLKKSINSLEFAKKIILGTVFVFIFSIFIFRYLVPVAVYKTPIPGCASSMSVERCLKNNVYYYETSARSTKNDRQAEPLQQYLLTWLKTIIMQLDTSASITSSGLQVGKAMPVFSALMAFSAFLGTFSLIYCWRTLEKDGAWYFLIGMTVILIFVVFAFNAFSYYSAHLDLNTQTRYLLSIVPVLMIMSIISINSILGKRQSLKMIILLVLLVLSTQGGGVIKPIINANEDWFWQNQKLQRFNQDIKNKVVPLVVE